MVAGAFKHYILVSSGSEWIAGRRTDVLAFLLTLHLMDIAASDLTLKTTCRSIKELKARKPVLVTRKIVGQYLK